MKTENRAGLYTVLDIISRQLIGGIQLHRHPAAAVRMFTDALKDPKTILAAHPEDFELILVGYMSDDDQTIEPMNAVVLEGRAWAMSQTPPEETPNTPPQVPRPRK